MNSKWNPSSSTDDSLIPKSGRYLNDKETKYPKSIPMPSSHIPKTHSEVQLSEDLAAAEWRDLCMFYRVVQGIRERQQVQQSPSQGAYRTSFNAEQVTPPTEYYHHRTSQGYHEEDNGGVAIDEDGFLASVMRQTDSQEKQEQDCGWSIGGYVEPSTATIQKRTPAIVENDTDDDNCCVEEDGVFNMDL